MATEVADNDLLDYEEEDQAEAGGNKFFLLCLFTELGAVCLQFREDPKSTNRVEKNFFRHKFIMKS